MLPSERVMAAYTTWLRLLRVSVIQATVLSMRNCDRNLNGPAALKLLGWLHEPSTQALFWIQLGVRRLYAIAPTLAT